MQQKLLILNFKQFLERKKIPAILKSYSKFNNKNIDTIVLPPVELLEEFTNKKYKFHTGVQNISKYKEGAFTGEVNINNLDKQIEYVLLGHSERRTIFDETNKDIEIKLGHILDSKRIPILCVGENLKEYKDKKLLQKRLGEDLKILTKNKKIKEIIIAYEPIWAISNQNKKVKVTYEKIEMAFQYIKQFIKTKLKNKKIKIIYGGSMHPDLVTEFVQKNRFDGLILGHASIDTKAVTNIYKNLTI